MPDPTGGPLHPDVEALAFLLGTWAGEGTGTYPTVEPFDYTEESVFWHVGKPFIGYRQRTWHGDDGRPSHMETGYWRCPEAGRVELVIAHPNGLVEVSEGHCEQAVISLASTVVARTSTAKDVSAVARRVAVVNGDLEYSLKMAAVGVPLGLHLRARLRRVDTAGPG